MSRDYTATRVRGLASWAPQSKTQVLLDRVDDVLDEYHDHLPLTCRQIFYRLVGRYGYPKDENAYSRLLEMLNRARRAGLIRFDAIRDDGVTQEAAGGFHGKVDFWEAVHDTAKNYRRDLGDGQPYRVEVWVEAAGMVPQVSRVAHRYGATVFSSGGFDSLTAKHEAAQRAKAQRTVILSIGDHDPSGWALFDNAAEDVPAMTADLGGPSSVQFERVAVTPEQVERYGLTTYPAKVTDRRGGWTGPTCQCEALDPPALAHEIEQAILRHIVPDAIADVQEQGKRERLELLRTLDGLDGGKP